MTVLKGDLATKRSKALIRIIKQMKMSTQHFCYAIHHSKCRRMVKNLCLGVKIT